MGSIAVVIPCFNLGRFIDEAVQSVLRQTREAAEVVVVDDGSTDLFTRERLAVMDHPRTRIARTDQRGVSAARNEGIRLTSAEYVVTLDGDDRLTPLYLARTAERLDGDPALDFVSTGIRAFGDATYVWTPPAPSLEAILVRGAPHPASMFRRRVWSAAGGFDESRELQGCEDFAFWLSAMARGCRGDVINEPLLEYRVRVDSLHQGLVSSGRQAGAMGAVFRKHQEAIEDLDPRLLVEKDRFIEEQRAHQLALVRRKAELAAELEALERSISLTVKALTRLGSWGEIDGVARFTEDSPPREGVPIDSAFVEAFLRDHLEDVTGRVLLVGDDLPEFVALLGRCSGQGSAVPSCRRVSPEQLSRLPDASADCIVTTRLIRCAELPRDAIAELTRVLTPGGVLLCTMPAVRLCEDGPSDREDLWRFTEAAVRRLFAEILPPTAFNVTVHGNVFVCAALLAGVPMDRLTPGERDRVDPMFPLIYCVRAVKP